MLHDFDNVPECLDKVIALLDEAAMIMAHVMKMPFAEPQEPAWTEFHKRPHIHEIVDVYFSISDAEKLTKKTLAEIDGSKNIP